MQLSWTLIPGLGVPKPLPLGQEPPAPAGWHLDVLPMDRAAFSCLPHAKVTSRRSAPLLPPDLGPSRPPSSTPFLGSTGKEEAVDDSLWFSLFQ